MKREFIFEVGLQKAMFSEKGGPGRARQTGLLLHHRRSFYTSTTAYTTR